MSSHSSEEPAPDHAQKTEALPREAVTAPSLPQTLSGFRIGVTSDRRSEELIAAFQRRGAEVTHAPALRIASLTESVALQQETNAVIASAPDYVIITTAYGMRRWAEAAETYGVWPELYAALSNASILVRGPKARGAVRAAGLDDDGAAEDERTDTMLDMLLQKDLHGKTVAFQLHGMLNHRQVQRIEDAGASVCTVMPYTWTKPAEDSDLLKMINAVIDRQLDMVTFTAAPAVDAFLGVAQQYGKREELVDALQSDVLTAAVGAVTANPLADAGVEAIIPDRWRLGALIKKVCDHLESHHIVRAETAYGAMEIRGHQVRFPESSATPVRLPPAPLALLRELVMADGAVLSREELLDVLPHCDSERALEMLVSRLRKSLQVSSVVQTVVKRGYRLAV